MSDVTFNHVIGPRGYRTPQYDADRSETRSLILAWQVVIMKMATGLEFCEDEGDLLADDTIEERDPNFVEERFRVDRRKLEQMLQGQSCLRLDRANFIYS